MGRQILDIMPYLDYNWPATLEFNCIDHEHQFDKDKLKDALYI